MARANDKLGELSPQQVEGIVALAAEVERKLPELLHAAQNWHSISIEGVLLQKLGIDHAERRIAALVRMAPGSSLPAHTHDEGEQCVVLHGELAIGDHCIVAGQYRYWKPGEAQPRQTTEHGCLLLVSSPLD